MTRVWKKGDRVELRFKLEPRVVVGDHRNQGKVAVLYGPLVLAADQSLLGLRTSISMPLPRLARMSPRWASNRSRPHGHCQFLASAPMSSASMPWPARHSGSLKPGAPLDCGLSPSRTRAQPAAPTKSGCRWGWPRPAATSCSTARRVAPEQGTWCGSINDEDFESFVVTFDNQPKAEDWFAVALDEPGSISRVVFAHGQTFHDGGWFDASAGKPRIQVKASKDAAWETAGELKDYPATTANNPAGLKGGERFTCQFANPAESVRHPGPRQARLRR